MSAYIDWKINDVIPRYGTTYYNLGAQSDMLMKNYMILLDMLMFGSRHPPAERCVEKWERKKIWESPMHRQKDLEFMAGVLSQRFANQRRVPQDYLQHVHTAWSRAKIKDPQTPIVFLVPIDDHLPLGRTMISFKFFFPRYLECFGGSRQTTMIILPTTSKDRSKTQHIQPRITSRL